MALILITWYIDILIILAAIIAPIYFHFTSNLDFWAKKGLTHLKPKILFGSFLPVLLGKRNPGQFFTDVYNTYTDPYIGLFIFNRPYLLLRDPEVIKNILVKDFNNFSNRSNADCSITDPIGANNLFTMKNPQWKAMRVKLTHIFTSSKLKMLYPLINSVGEQLNQHIGSKLNKLVRMKEISSKYSVDIISSVAFGVESNSFKDENSRLYQAALDFSDVSLKRAFEFISYFFLPFFVKLLKFTFFGPKATEILRSAFEEAIIHREKTGFKRNDLVDLLLNLKHLGRIDTDMEPEIVDGKLDLNTISFNNSTLIGQAAVFFVAGYDSTSSGIAFCLYELAKQPKWQELIRDEIRNAVIETNGEVTYEIFPKLKALDMCVQEALRMYPPLSFLDRECDQEYTMPDSGIKIDVGTPVIIPVIALHRDPQYFPNPDVFDPERFSDENADKIVPFTYLPFGEGPHGCIAKRMGLAQLKLGLIHILKDFGCEPEDINDKMELDPKGLITTPLRPIQLKFYKWKTK